VHRREIYDQIRDANQSAVVKPDRLAAVAERLKSTNHQPPTTNHQPPTTNRESDSL
jgi:sRNA-binding carbon storage regulator CsrA